MSLAKAVSVLIALEAEVVANEILKASGEISSSELAIRVCTQMAHHKWTPRGHAEVTRIVSEAMVQPVKLHKVPASARAEVAAIMVERGERISRDHWHGLIASLEHIKAGGVVRSEASSCLEYDAEETPPSPEVMEKALDRVYGKLPVAVAPTRKGKTKECKYCGQNGFKWNNEGGRWVLRDSAGAAHNCRNSKPVAATEEKQQNFLGELKAIK